MAKKKATKKNAVTKTTKTRVVTPRVHKLTAKNLAEDVYAAIYAVKTGTIDVRTASAIFKGSQEICRINSEIIKKVKLAKKITKSDINTLLIG